MPDFPACNHHAIWRMGGVTQSQHTRRRPPTIQMGSMTGVFALHGEKKSCHVLCVAVQCSVDSPDQFGLVPATRRLELEARASGLARRKSATYESGARATTYLLERQGNKYRSFLSWHFFFFEACGRVAVIGVLVNLTRARGVFICRSS